MCLEEEKKTERNIYDKNLLEMRRNFVVLGMILDTFIQNCFFFIAKLQIKDTPKVCINHYFAVHNFLRIIIIIFIIITVHKFLCLFYILKV